MSAEADFSMWPRAGGGWNATIDGKHIEDFVRSCSVRIEGPAAKVTLELAVPLSAALTAAKAKITLSDDERDLLIMLGWTPPEET